MILGRLIGWLIGKLEVQFIMVGKMKSLGTVSYPAVEAVTSSSWEFTRSRL